MRGGEVWQDELEVRDDGLEVVSKPAQAAEAGDGLDAACAVPARDEHNAVYSFRDKVVRDRGRRFANQLFETRQAGER